MSVFTAERKSSPCAELCFDAEAHRYTVGGRRIPSVTEILKETGLIDVRWFTEEARFRGTSVHTYSTWLDMDIARAEDFSGHPYGGWIRAYERFLEESLFVPREIEIPLAHSSLLFAGTPDRIGGIADEGMRKAFRIKSSDTLILDLKTGAFQPWHPLQLEAYRIMAREAFLFPGALRLFGLYLRENGRYSLRECSGDFRAMWMKLVDEYQERAA